MRHNLLIGVIGHRHAGKSITWDTLFGRKVKTGRKRLYLTETEYIDVFLIYGSPEERRVPVGEILGGDTPRIVLCSIQYIEAAFNTINFFNENDYYLYFQWLNPGRTDGLVVPYADHLGLTNRVLPLESVLSVRNGIINPQDRTREIRDVLYGWAASRGLLRT